MKVIAWMLVIMLSVSVPVYALPDAASSIAQDNVVDKVGDWAATIGKSGIEKDKILAERKATRVAKKAERKAKKAAREAEKEARKAAKMKDKKMKEAKNKAKDLMGS